VKTRIGIIVVAAILVLAAAVVVRFATRPSGPAARSQPPTLVKVELPQHARFAQTLQLTGDVLPIRQAEVFARVYGNVDSVAVNIGDRVRPGVELAHIDTTELAQQYRQTGATYDDASAVFERATALFQKALISDQDYQAAQTAMQVAKENFDAARTRLNYATILAPFGGVITRRYVDPGALLTASNAGLFTLMDLDTIKVIVSVLENDVPSVAAGIGAIVTVDAFPARNFAGTVTRLSDAVDPTNRTMPVEIDIPNPGHALKPGMFATVSLILGEQHDALTVPTQAVLKDAEGQYVLTAVAGLARRRAVTIGSEENSRTEILSGLTDADSVITTGQQFTHDGGPITVTP